MADTNQVITRDQQQETYTWNLGDIFPSLEAWEAAFAQLKAAQADNEAAFSGKLAQRETMLAALAALYVQEEQLYLLYAYAGLYRSQDNANPQAQAMLGRVESLYATWQSGIAFLRPELLTLPENQLRAYAADPAFSDYDVYLTDLLRDKPHTLDKAQEKMLSMVDEVFSAQGNVFDMLSYVDMHYPDIPNEHGEMVPLTDGRYLGFLQNKNQKVRKAAFETLLGTYAGYANTLSATYNATVKANIFRAAARVFPGAREAALFPDQVPLSVYDGLIDAVHRNLPALSKYVALRRKAFDLPQVRLYDLYVPMAQDFELDLPYDEAYNLVVDALAVLGPDYQQVLRRAHDQRWIDVYENKGKDTGAFCQGSARKVHPYVLLNYEPGLRETLTIAHEMGHAMHSYLSNKAQPFPKAGYTIFAAEVASTVNEVLVLEALLQKYPQREAQACIIGNLLENFRTTVYRQTMFAEFERTTHQLAQDGEPLTAQVLNQAYLALNQLYYGQEAVIDPLIESEWSRIPHFYNAFYVYKYATGFSAAVAIVKRIRELGQPAVDDYLRFLTTGGSLPPIEELKIAGVDMSTSAPVEAALAYFDELIDRFEKLL